MLKRKYRPNYAALYPCVHISDEALSVLKKSDRKMEYQEYDLKVERPVRNVKRLIVALLPAREDSLERLIVADVQFASDAYTPEEVIEAREGVSELYRCLDLLNSDERALIDSLFFKGLTEREYATRIGLSQKTINKHKHQALRKLRKFFNF